MPTLPKSGFVMENVRISKPMVLEESSLAAEAAPAGCPFHH
jgi:hypothetical protein